MAELKSVWFAPDGKWFESRESCEDYELLREVACLINNHGIVDHLCMDIAIDILSTYIIYKKETLKEAYNANS